MLLVFGAPCQIRLLAGAQLAKNDRIGAPLGPISAPASSIRFAPSCWSAGIAVRQGLRFLRAELPSILANRTDVLSPRMLHIKRGA